MSWGDREQMKFRGLEKLQHETSAKLKALQEAVEAAERTFEISPKEVRGILVEALRQSKKNK